MDNQMEDTGRDPSEPGCQPTASAAEVASSQSGIPNAAQKSIYFDMTVRALEEMIENERKWIEQPAETVLAHVRSDALYPYANNMAGDVYQRAIRLSVLGSVLNMMTRYFRNASASETPKGDTQ